MHCQRYHFDSLIKEKKKKVTTHFPSRFYTLQMGSANLTHSTSIIRLSLLIKLCVSVNSRLGLDGSKIAAIAAVFLTVPEIF